MPERLEGRPLQRAGQRMRDRMADEDDAFGHSIDISRGRGRVRWPRDWSTRRQEPGRRLLTGPPWPDAPVPRVKGPAVDDSRDVAGCVRNIGRGRGEVA